MFLSYTTDICRRIYLKPLEHWIKKIVLKILYYQSRNFVFTLKMFFNVPEFKSLDEKFLLTRVDLITILCNLPKRQNRQSI